MIQDVGNELILNGETVISYQKHMIIRRNWCLSFREEEEGLIFSPGRGVSLEEWAREEPSLEELMRLILAVRELSVETGKYLLDEDHFYLDPKWVFWEKEGALLQAVYLPIRLDHGNGLEGWFPDYLWQAAAENNWSGKEILELLFRYKKLALKKDTLLLSESAEPKEESDMGNRMLPALYHPPKKKEKRKGLKFILNHRKGILH